MIECLHPCCGALRQRFGPRTGFSFFVDDLQSSPSFRRSPSLPSLSELEDLEAPALQGPRASPPPPRVLFSSPPEASSRSVMITLLFFLCAFRRSSYADTFTLTNETSNVMLTSPFYKPHPPLAPAFLSLEADIVRSVWEIFLRRISYFFLACVSALPFFSPVRSPNGPTLPPQVFCFLPS